MVLVYTPTHTHTTTICPLSGTQGAFINVAGIDEGTVNLAVVPYAGVGRNKCV